MTEITPSFYSTLDRTERRRPSGPPEWRRSAARAAAPLALMALIYYLSDQPDLSSGLGVWDLIGRKIAHMAEYAALLGLLLWALRPATRRGLPVAILLAAAYAVSDELHQSGVEGRNGSPVDVGIDWIGVSLAALAVRYDGRRRRSRSR